LGCYSKATLIFLPNDAANFSSVDSLISIAWFSILEITDLVF
jgi:hypothetical protein